MGITKPKREKPRKCVVVQEGQFLCGRPARPEYNAAAIHRANSKAAGRRLVLEAQAQEDLLVAANAALAELARLDGLATSRRTRVKPGAYLRLKNALWHLDALDG